MQCIRDAHTARRIDTTGTNRLLAVSERRSRQPRSGRRIVHRCAAAAAGGSDNDRCIIIGAGIAGLASAVALHKAGIPVLVLERAASLPLGGTSIGLWTNAFKALESLGLADEVRAAHPVACDRIELCSAGGALLRTFSFDVCAGGPHEFRGVGRAALLHTLAGALPEGVLRFGQTVQRVDNDPDGSAVATLASGERLAGRALVGADGSRSAAASALNVAPPNYAGYAAYRGIATFPGGVPLPDATTRLVYGSGVRAGLNPIAHDRAYWFTCFNAPNVAVRQSPAEAAEDALRNVEGWAWDVDRFIAATPPEDIVRSRIADRWLLPGSTFGSGCVTLAGDAAHPMTPNLGQGGCTSLEDGVVLAQQLARCWRGGGAGEIAAALRSYEAERSGRVAPLTLRSYAFGALLQIPFAPVVAARELVMSRVLSFDHFLDHATYAPGPLPTPVTAAASLDR